MANDLQFHVMRYIGPRSDGVEYKYANWLRLCRYATLQGAKQQADACARQNKRAVFCVATYEPTALAIHYLCN